MHELLRTSHLEPEEALERCHRYLASRWRRWRLARLALPRDLAPDLVPLLAWHELVREAADLDSDGEPELDDLIGVLDGLTDELRTPIGTALAPVVRRHSIPMLVLRGPLEERRRVRQVHTFETRAALLAHARRIAEPEARLYLRLAGHTAEREEVLADALAGGIQLAAWLAHLSADLPRGRLFVAVEDLNRHQLDILAFRGDPGERGRRVVAEQVRWARELLQRGWPLCDELGPWRGRLLAFVLRWHSATLAALEARRFDAFSGPPPAGWLRAIACGATSLASVRPPRLG